MNDEITRALRIVAAGLSRFFDEGHTRWSKEEVGAPLEPPLHLEDSAFRGQLQKWESEGSVQLERDGVYLTVMRPLDS